MKTIKQLGFDIISHLLGGRSSLIKDEICPTWFDRGMTVSEHRPTHGRAGKIFYVWGPALGLQKLDLAVAKTFLDAIGEMVLRQDHTDCSRIPTHIVCHEWDTNTNHCLVHRFYHEYDHYFRQLVESKLTWSSSPTPLTEARRRASVRWVFFISPTSILDVWSNYFQTVTFRHGFQAIEPLRFVDNLYKNCMISGIRLTVDTGYTTTPSPHEPQTFNLEPCPQSYCNSVCLLCHRRPNRFPSRHRLPYPRNHHEILPGALHQRPGYPGGAPEEKQISLIPSHPQSAPCHLDTRASFFIL